MQGALTAEGTFKITFSLFSSNSLPVYIWQRALFVSGIGLVFFTYIVSFFFNLYCEMLNAVAF